METIVTKKYDFLYLPKDFWETKECSTARSRIQQHCGELAQDDAAQSRLWALAPTLVPAFSCNLLHYDKVITTEADFKSSFEKAAWNVVERLVRTFDGSPPEGWKFSEFVQTLVDLAADYVPRLAEWSRENVKEIPESLSTAAVWELSYHTFMEMLQGFWKPIGS